MAIVILILFMFAAGIGIGFCFGFAKGREIKSAISARRTATVRAWFLFGMGCLVLLLGLGGSLYSWNFARTATSTTGTIIDMLEKKGKDSGDRSYAPVFAFRDTLGSTQVVSSSHYSYPPEFRIGDTVPVLYQERDSKNAWINSFQQRWILPILGCIIGSLLLSVELILLYWQRRKSQIAARV